MVKIKVHTERVREVSTKFKAESDHHDQIVGELQRALGRLDTGSWDGRSRAKAEPLLRRVRPEGTRVVEELSRLGQTLQRVAERFEQEDASAAQNLSGMPWVDFESQGGQVLGVAAVADLQAIYGLSASARSDQALKIDAVAGEAYKSQLVLEVIAVWLASQDFSKMTWASRFKVLETFTEQIPHLKSKVDRIDELIAKDNAGIADLQGQIDELKKKREELQKKAEQRGNKVAWSEDGGWGFDDGLFDAPWRTKSDDYEDEIAELDEQIASLEAEKSRLEANRELHLNQRESASQELQSVQSAKDNLEGIISDGIPGGSTPNGTRAGCVLFVSERRDISDFNGTGTPNSWEGRASERGYDTGKIPVKGAIMVHDSERLPRAIDSDGKEKDYCAWNDADGTKQTMGLSGHVEYVTDVRAVQRDGKTVYEVTVEGAATKEDASGNTVWNTYCDEYTKSYTIDPESLPDGIWYLYDKKQV